MVNFFVYGNGVGAFNEKGGTMARYINKTGAPSVKGALVEPSDTTDFGVKLANAGGPDVIGAVYESGVADGDYVWVTYSGPAQVLLKDSTASTREYWSQISSTDNGRADCTDAAPAGGTITELRGHLEREIGHCMESVSSGTDVLCWIHLHFN